MLKTYSNRKGLKQSLHCAAEPASVQGAEQLLGDLRNHNSQ